MTKQNKQNLDEETQKVLSEGEELKLLVEGNGWKIARSKLIQKLVNAADITTLDTSDLENLARDIASRKLAVKMIYEWLQEIEGSAKQHMNNQESFMTSVTEEIYLDLRT